MIEEKIPSFEAKCYLLRPLFPQNCSHLKNLFLASN